MNRPASPIVLRGPRRSLRTGVAFCLLLFPSCGRESGTAGNPRAEPPTAKDSATQPPITKQETNSNIAVTSKTTSGETPRADDTETDELPTEIRLDRLNLPGENLLADPDRAGWDTEALNDAASAQFKLLGKLLESPASLSHEQAASLVTDSFRCAELRPSTLQVVFEDQSLTVYRPATGTGSIASDSNAGVQGLVVALQEMLKPLRGARQVHSKAKIFRVSIADQQPTTSVFFHVSGRTTDGIVEQNATWQCRWQWSPGDVPRLTSITVEEFEEVHARSASGALFSDCTEAVLKRDPAYREQLAYGTDHWLDRLEYRYGLDAAGWEGLAVGDVNGDGLDDLFVCQPGGLPNRLFVQQSDGTARDMAAEAGLDWLDATHSVLLVDLDNDGDQDMAAAMSMGVAIFSNDGSGRFQLKTAKLLPEAMPYSLAAADFDHDRDLDIFVCCYSKRESGPSRRFLGRPLPYHDANNGGRNALLRNDRNWRFRDVAREVGLNENNRRFSFAAAWEDYDLDGDLDLYVANDYGRNSLYRCQDGQFTDVAAAAGVEDISAGMSVSWGDANGDGWPDLYVSNMWSSAGNRITFQRRFKSDTDERTLADYRRHARGNSLFLNAGDGTFVDGSEEAGVTMGRWAWGSGFVDLNNDGLQDLVVANGFLTQSNPDDL